jgi:hypothetical protein
MTPMPEQEVAVLKSVTYAALFDYPLTLEQLHVSLVGVRATPALVLSWWQRSEFLQASVEYVDGWFFPAGRRDLVGIRSRRESVSRELLARDERILRLIAGLPFVRMVAVSGSLAHLNAEGSADLDLFVITAPGRVWSVTLTALVIAKLLGIRKHVCLNYVLSERAMAIGPQDLFSANQIIHLRPTFGQCVFERFVKSNEFVRAYYPNFEMKANDAASSGSRLKTVAERALSLGPAQLAERMARAFYGWHLRRKAATWQSKDQVKLEPECLKLHTSSHRAATMERLEAALENATTKNTKALKVLAS